MAMAAAGPRLAALLSALQAAQAPAAASTEFDANALSPALRALALLLDNGDMAATDTMAALQRDFGGALGDRLQPLDDAVGALDFERALQLCHELIEGQPA